MISAALPENESSRQAALRDLEILDSEPEQEFEALVRAASLACDVPISLISLVDADRQWFKAKIGLDGVAETPRDIAFCTHAIADDALMIVPDAMADGRFADNPLVAGDPNIRFYAGAPLRLDSGHRIGTLCVIDRHPRVLTETQREILELLAEAAVNALQSRRQKKHLQAQYQRLAYVLDASKSGSWEWDVETGKMHCSEYWAVMLGKPVEELHAMSAEIVRDLTHPEDLARADALLAKHFAGETENFELEARLRHARGYWVWVLTRGRVMTWTPKSKPRLMFGTHEDITERKQREELTKRNAQFLDRTGRMAGIGGWEMDLNTGHVVFSEETARIHGVPEGYVPPNLADAVKFFAPEVQPIIQSAIEGGVLEGKSWDLELPFISGTGKHLWVRATGDVDKEDGAPAKLIGTFQDITERMSAYHALQRANERVVLATDSGGIGIWEWDLATNEMYWDPWMYRLYGLEPRDGPNPLELWWSSLHPDDLAEAERNAAAAITGTGPLEDIDFRIVRPDGTIRMMHGSGHVARDDAGKAQRIVGSMYDVTETRALAAELAEQHELLRVTLQSIGDAVITTDASGLISWMNPVAERMTGWTAAEAERRQLDQVFRIVNEQTRQPEENPVAECLAQGKIIGLANHTSLISRDGTEFGIEDSAAPILNKDGKILGVVLVFHDVTEQRRMSGEMTYRATHDVLTGLVNRTEFEDRLRRMLASAHETRKQHSLLYIDLDQFKLVNDACGHSVGDQLLQQVAKLLTEAVRSRDTVARLGGDEFAVILDHCGAEPGQRIAQQICDRMEDFRFLHDGRRFRVGTSIGLVPIDNRWANPAAIMQAADTSCYAAKEAGRNRVHAWFDTDQKLRARHGEMQWTTRIEQALDEDGFVLFAQRIAPLQGQDQGVHAEILLRMLDTDGSLILPGAFLPAAERFHLVSRIDRWVLRHVIQWMRTIPSHVAIEQLSVNVSGHSIGDRAFHRWAIDLLTEAGRGACKILCIEITETAAITNASDARQFIEEVRHLGVRVALDDFGAGASSFGYLKTLPVDYLKIDGQFIQNFIDNPLDEAAVRSFVDVASIVGVKTVAEFVDRPEVMTRIQEMGIDLAQGFFVHEPAPLAELIVADVVPLEPRRRVAGR